MQFDPADRNHPMARFLDPAAERWICFQHSFENNSIPLGNDCYYALRLGSDGIAELAIKEYHGYTFELELHLVIRGRWNLHPLGEKRFALHFIDPTFDIVQEEYGIDAYLRMFRDGRPWVVDLAAD